MHTNTLACMRCNALASSTTMWCTHTCTHNTCTTQTRTHVCMQVRCLGAFMRGDAQACNIIMNAHTALAPQPPPLSSLQAIHASAPAHAHADALEHDAIQGHGITRLLHCAFQWETVREVHMHTCASITPASVAACPSTLTSQRPSPSPPTTQ